MDSESVQTFGECIRSLRESTSKSQFEIAKILDIDPSLLGKIERNERRPNRDMIKKFAKIFKQDEEKLLEEFLSDHIANKIIRENGNLKTLRIAEKKIIYLNKINNAE